MGKIYARIYFLFVLVKAASYLAARGRSSSEKKSFCIWLLKTSHLHIDLLAFIATFKGGSRKVKDQKWRIPFAVQKAFGGRVGK